MSRLPTLLFVVVVLLAATGCGGGTATDTATTDRTARKALFDALAAREGGASLVTYAETLAHYLPTQRIRVGNGPSRIPALGVVAGDVVSAEISYAGKIAQAGGSGSGEVESSTALDDPTADWRLITATVQVERAWVKGKQTPNRVQFVVPIGGSADPEPILRGLRSLDRAVVALTRTDPTTPSAFRLARDNLAIGIYDSKGLIDFPAMTEEEESRFLLGTRTLAQVAEQAQTPQPVIAVNADGTRRN